MKNPLPLLHHGAEAILRLVFPERCQLCSGLPATPREGYVCVECRRSLKVVSSPFCARCGLPFEGELEYQFDCPNCQESHFSFSRARAAIEAKGAGMELIHRYKYHRALWFEPLFADLLRTHALPDLAGQAWTGVVPVPLHAVKEREREFNQADRLGRLLATALGVPLRADLVVRPVATVTQTRLSRKDRVQNVRRAFAPASNADLAGTRWIVVDDVFTTGSTTDAVARVLRKQGAQEVVVWTLGRGL